MRILQVVHGFPPAASAGTEVYVRNLARALAENAEDDVRVFTRDADSHRAELRVREAWDGNVRVTAVNNTFQSCATFEDSYANAAIERIAGAFLDEWRPDIIHVQHLTCLSTGIPRQAAQRGIPVVMTLNDYWLICHRGQLVDLAGASCGGPFDGGCAQCIEPAALANEAAIRAGRSLRALPVPGAATAVRAATHLVSAVMLAASTRAASLARLRHMQAAVRDVRLFLAPSDTIAAKFIEFGIPKERLVRCDQGIVLPASVTSGPSALNVVDQRGRASSRRAVFAPLRLGFAGGLQPTKGLHVLLDAIEQLPKGAVTLDVFGAAASYHGEDEYMSMLQSRLGHPAIRRLGPAPHERMASRLADIDVLVVPSVWIENAPFIIREAFACGLPVVASDLGGMAEMVRHEQNGLLFAPGDAAALAIQVRRLLDEPALIESLRAGIVRPMSIEEDAARLREMYASVAGSVRPAINPAAAVVPACRPAVSAIVLNYRTPQQTCIAVRSLQTSRPAVAGIHVIDNGSDDGSVESLRASLHDVCVTPLSRNVGFPAGCNVGIREALNRGAEYVLLVNSDVVLAPDAIDRLVAVMNDQQIGIAGPVVLSREEPDHIASAGIAFSTRTGRMRHRGAGARVGSLAPESPHTVDAVSGCVMLIRRDVFDRVGLLDDAYFFSFEDVEFCLRAREAGFRTVCVQDAVAYHEGGRTIGRRSARRVYFATRNHLRLAMSTGSPSGRPFRAGLVIGLNAAYVLVSPEAPLAGGVAALVRGAWHHFSGRYGPD